jgi:hypothetical protein
MSRRVFTIVTLFLVAVIPGAVQGQLTVPAAVSASSRAIHYPPTVGPAVAASQRPHSRWPFVLGGAVLGGTLGVILSQVRTSAHCNNCVYPGTIIAAGAGGAVVGAFAGYLVHDIFFGETKRSDVRRSN